LEDQIKKLESQNSAMLKKIEELSVMIVDEEEMALD
jgi:uncharacterized coiled-coil protein SlyX